MNINWHTAAEWFLSYAIGLQTAESQVLLDFLMVASLIISKTLLNRMSLLTCYALLVERLHLTHTLSLSRSQFNNFDYFYSAEYSSYECMCIFSALVFFIHVPVKDISSGKFFPQMWNGVTINVYLLFTYLRWYKLFKVIKRSIK